MSFRNTPPRNRSGSTSNDAQHQVENFQENLMHFYNSQEGPNGRHWQLLLDLFFKKKTGKPTKKWLQQNHELIGQLTPEVIAPILTSFLSKAIELLQLNHHHKGQPAIYFLNDNFLELTKGIIWTAGLINDSALNDAIENLGLWCFKKIPGHGAIAVKLGNACLYAFSNLPFQIGIEKLTRFRMKIKYPSVRKKIQKYIETVSEREGKTADEIEEMVVSDFGLNEYFAISKTLGIYRGVVKINGVNNVSLNWWKGEDIPLKTLPPAIRKVFETDILQLKKTAKDIKSYLPIQRTRIEQFYLKKRIWTYNEWAGYYIHHPLVSFIAQKLIWEFSNGKKKTTAIYIEGQWKNANGDVIDWINEKTTVTLWHPIGYPAESVLQWRQYLRALEIQQPFKQAFREIYLLTDAEINTESYSNRFAAHVLRQHQFGALCKVRGWHFILKGRWDSDSTPRLQIPQWEMSAEYWVDADWNGVSTPNGVFNFVFTDQVRFYENDHQLNMEDIPPIVFSEVMRDVDLFVGVTSIGNDPNWRDGENGNDYDDYWHNYSFSALSESAKMRKEVLQNLIPRLKIAKRCSFDGKYLVVKGDIRTYKIHIGSGNILMTPNDQYLCIVADRKKESTQKVFLPFEGDQMLSIIISKAFMLAEDLKIKDSTIISQLRS